jgi:hypothetical protein
MPVAEKRKRRSADKTLTDHVCDYMHDNCRALSIDTLLTRPLDAMRMGLFVAARSGKIPATIARNITHILKQLEEFPEAIDEIEGVCRAALNGRKHGDITRDRY